MRKNVASQKLIVFVFDATTNLPKTGDAANLTAYVSIDYGSVTALTDTSATEMDSTNAKGYYLFDLTQAETNGDVLLFSCKSSTANMVAIGVPARVLTSCLPNVTAGASGGLWILGTNTGTVTLTASSSNTAGFTIIGNGTGHGLHCKSGTGATGDGFKAESQATNGNGSTHQGTGTGAGLQGSGTTGIYGSANAASGIGILGAATGAGAVGIQGKCIDGTSAGFAIQALCSTGNTVALKLSPSGSGTALSVAGPADVTGAFTLTSVTTSGTVTFDSFVPNFAADSITATSIAADAITAAKVADGTIDAATFAAGAITATVIADDAIDAAALASSAIAEITAGIVLVRSTIGSTGNDTTHLHLDGLTYGDDEINNLLLVVYDVSEAEYHPRWITDWDLSDELATVATLPFTPQNATDTYWLLSIRNDVTASGGSADWTADERTAIRTILGIPGSGTTPDVPAAGALKVIDDFLDTEIAAIKTKTDFLPSATAGDAGGLVIAGSNAATTFATLTSTGALTAGTNAIPWNAAWDAEVQSECNDALVAQRLNELMNADSDLDGGAPPTVGSVFHELMSKTTGSFTYDQTTDSLEAIRDRGDAAWVTGPTAAAIATAVWQDSTSGDFTAANSIGKCLYINNVAPGAAGGHFIAGSNAATTVASLTCTGQLVISDGVAVTCSTTDRSAFVCTGNGEGYGIRAISGSGTTGAGLQCHSAAGVAGLLCSTHPTLGNAAVSIQGDTAAIDISGPIVTDDAVTIGGAVTFSSTFDIAGDTTFTGAITGTNASNNLRINGVAPGAAGGLTIAGSNAATTFATLTVSGATTLTGAVSATNASNDIRGVKLHADGLDLIEVDGLNFLDDFCAGVAAVLFNNTELDGDDVIYFKRDGTTEKVRITYAGAAAERSGSTIS